MTYKLTIFAVAYILTLKAQAYNMIFTVANDYPIRFADQLRQHLRALRKKRGLTQAQVGALVGVSQARIAEIEANPGLVSFDQLMQLLSALGVTVSLCEAPSVLDAAEPMRKALERTKKITSQRNSRVHSKKGSW